MLTSSWLPVLMKTNLFCSQSLKCILAEKKVQLFYYADICTSKVTRLVSLTIL